MFNIQTILNNNPKIAVFGDIMLDCFTYGDVSRISPEAPIPIVQASHEINSLGGCGNVIQNLANLGTSITIISAIGKDRAGSQIYKSLEKIGVDLEQIIVTKKRKTTYKMRVIGGNQHVVRVDWDGPSLYEEEFRVAIGSINKMITDSIDAIIISDYGKGMVNRELASMLIDKAKNRSIPVFVDPKFDSWNKYAGATFITPNQNEASSIVNNTLVEDNDYIIAAETIRKKYKIDNCLITRGKDGMSFVGGGDRYHIPAFAREVFDVSGAGDTVIACLAYGISAGVSVQDAVSLANFAAGVVVGHLGTAAITKDELVEFKSG